MQKTRQLQLTLLISFLIAVCISCSKPKAIIPEGVLSEKEMIPVLVDIHIAQSAIGLYDPEDSVKYTMNDLLPYILKIHHIEKIKYDSTISFYTRHPEIMQQMYDEVINEISKKQGEASK
jgi:hypothetical protein